jgi:predicted PurR-regulated permease PerM
VGVFIGFVLSVLTALIQDPSLLLPVCGVFAAGHVLEGSFITPRLEGERIGLHPVMVILALLSFGQLLGFFGIVIALPASAVARILLGHLHQIWWSRETTP